MTPHEYENHMQQGLDTQTNEDTTPPAKVETPEDADPENDSETCCKCCGDEYELRDGEEPTPYCDHCAHKVVERLELETNALRQGLEMLKCTHGELQGAMECNRKERDGLRQELEALRAELNCIRNKYEQD